MKVDSCGMEPWKFTVAIMSSLFRPLPRPLSRPLSPLPSPPKFNIYAQNNIYFSV